MKKRILVCLLAALCITAMLAACTPSGEQDGSPNEETASGALYYPGSSLGIVYAEEQVKAYLNDLYYEIADNLSKPPVIRRDTEVEIGQHELVIGKTNRPISIEAYKQLDRIEKQSDCDAKYVIYSDGSSVAIAFENDKFDLELALNKSLEKFLSLVGDESTYYVKSGVIASALIDPIAYQEAIDNVMVAEKWQELREEIEKRVSADGGTLRDKNGREVSASEYADGVVEQLQKFYSQYNDNVISWFANLYEPAIDGDYKNGGGFYYSNSGRNTEGYLPDIESTSQALNFIAGSGMASPYGYALPDWMREQIARFVKGAQAPNGYFYHIQWGQEMTDKKFARRGRDRSNAENILRELGVSPTYDTPNLEGDGIVINNHWVQPASTPLTMRLSSSVAQAVSRVTLTGTTSANSHLETKEALLNYLNNIIDIRNNCYGGGDELAAQGSDFIQRDKELKAQGADWSCSETVIEYLNDNVYESTGYWKSVVDYEGTNGLLKISALYNTLGAEFPYPEEAARSAIKTLTTSEEAQTICYVYNAWYSIANITTNLRKYSSDTEAGAALADKISLDLLKNCQNEIAVSLSKNSEFRKDDGSYSYFTYGTVSDSHDMPVAVPQVDEGDVNATEIGIVGLTGNMFNALDLKAYMPPLYTESDWMRYLDILEDLNPVIKDDDDSEVEFIIFDDEAVNEKTEYVDLEFNSSGSAIVVDDWREGQSGNVLRVETVEHNFGDTLRFDCNSLRLSASCFVFEFDMFLESSDSGNILQVTLGNKAYMLMISVDKSGIHLCDISSGSTPRLMNDFGVTLPKNEWFNIKIEYYVGTEENVRIMVYANGELAGVTDNYYDSTSARLKGKVGTPVNLYTEASIFAMSYVDAVYYLDNVACYKTNAIYDEITDPDKQPNINIDAPRDSHVVSAPANGKYFNDPEYADITTRYTYDFMGYPSPNLTGPLYGKMYCADGMLIFERKGDVGTDETYIQYKLDAPKDLTKYNNYCSIYEFDYRVSEADLSYDNTPFRLDDGNYIRFVKNTDGTTWSLVKADTAEIKCGEWSNIRFEVYYINEYTEIVKIYVDGKYATEVRLGEMSPFNSRLIMYMKKNVDKGTVINVDNMFIAHIDKAYVSEDGTTISPGPNTNIGTAKGEGAYYNGTVTENVNRWSFDDGATPSLTGTKGVKYIKDKTTLMFIRIDGADESKEVYVTYKAPSSPAQTANPCTVIELDFYANAIITGNYGLSFRFDDSNYAYFVRNTDETSYSIGTKDTAQIKAGQWHNIRFEIYYKSDSTLAEIYVDGVKSTEITLDDSTAYTTRLIVNMKAETPTDTLIAMDNVFIAHIDKEAPVAPTPDPDPDVPTEEPDEPVSGAGKGVYWNKKNSLSSYLAYGFDSEGTTLNGFGGAEKDGVVFATGSNISGAATLTKIADAWGVAHFYYNCNSGEFPGDVSAFNCKIFEFDYKMSAMLTSDARSLFRLDDNDYIRAYKNSDGVSISLGEKDAATITPDEWCNIRLEFYNVNGTKYVQIYVNDTYAYTQALTSTANTYNNRIYFYLEAAMPLNSTVCVDNFIMAYISKDYVENPTDTPEDSGDDSTETEPTEPTFELGKGVYYNSTSSAKSYKQFNFNTTGKLNGFGTPSTSYAVDTFATGTYVDGVATLERTANTWATAYFYYNIAESEFAGDITGATCKVFEFDYKISDMITADGRDAFRLDGNDYVKFYKNSDGTTLSLGAKDAMTITPGEWCNIRFEFYNVGGVKYMQIYVNNTYAYTQALADTQNTFNNRIYFYLESATSVGTAVCVDNLVIAYVDKAYEAN